MCFCLELTLTASEFVSNVYLVAAGKLPTFTTGSKKWNKIIAIGNNKIDTWQSEAGVDWFSLYNPHKSIGSVTASGSFPLGSDVRKLSDTYGNKVRIVHVDNETASEYVIVDPDKLYQYPETENVCAHIGSNLVFRNEFTSDSPQFGGDIQVPAFTNATHLISDSTVIPVDNPQWLILVTAAEYVRNDITKQNQYGNLINEANALMTSMREANDAQENTVIRPYEVLGASW